MPSGKIFRKCVMFIESLYNTIKYSSKIIYSEHQFLKLLFEYKWNIDYILNNKFHISNPKKQFNINEISTINNNNNISNIKIINNIIMNIMIHNIRPHIKEAINIIVQDILKNYFALYSINNIELNWDYIQHLLNKYCEKLRKELVQLIQITVEE